MYFHLKANIYKEQKIYKKSKSSAKVRKLAKRKAKFVARKAPKRESTNR